jgi:hypothetical protein
MFAYTKYIETNPVREHNLFEQVVHALDWTESDPRSWVRDDCSETVDTDLHFVTPDRRPDQINPWSACGWSQ